MQKIVIFLLFAWLPLYLSLATGPVIAAKSRVWKASTSRASTSGGKFSVSAKITGWKQYLNVSFKGMASTKGVNYELIYQGNGQDQGVFGSVKPSEGNAVRSIFLGTCSHKVCTPYKNINSMRLTISQKTTDGQSIVKKYRVKY